MNAGDAFGRTIQIIRFDGKSTNLRKAIVHGWVMLQFVSGASAFSNAAVRKRVNRTGVYSLSGLYPDKAALRRYISALETA